MITQPVVDLPDELGPRLAPCDSTDRWLFTQEQLYNTPSRPSMNYEAELRYRQQAANFIQDIGQRLSLPQLCINTAIVYMQRFFMFHSMAMFHWTSIAPAALLLAAKAQDHHRKVEHMIKITHVCLYRNRQFTPLKTGSGFYDFLYNDLILCENILLSTLGFELEVEHPHARVISSCQLLKLNKKVAKYAYLLASSSLHLTTLCLQYEPTIVACFCVHLACKFSNFEITPNSKGQPRFYEIDHRVTFEFLDRLTSQFSHIFEKGAAKLKNSIQGNAAQDFETIAVREMSNEKEEEPYIFDQVDNGLADSSNGIEAHATPSFGVAEGVSKEMDAAAEDSGVEALGLWGAKKARLYKTDKDPSNKVRINASEISSIEASVVRESKKRQRSTESCEVSMKKVHAESSHYRSVGKNNSEFSEVLQQTQLHFQIRTEMLPVSFDNNKTEILRQEVVGRQYM